MVIVMAIVGLIVLFVLILVDQSDGIFPCSIVKHLSHSEEDRFVEMYDSFRLPYTFKNRMIYKHITNNLKYRMRKYEESKDAKTKD